MSEKMSRQHANCLIVSAIANAVDKYPDQRFHQILQNIGVSLPCKDQFYEESTTTLKNISDDLKSKEDFL